MNQSEWQVLLITIDRFKSTNWRMLKLGFLWIWLVILKFN